MPTVAQQTPVATAPVLLYDGDCGFCTASVNWIRRVVRPAARMEAWQLADLAALGVTERQCRRSIQWIPTTGTPHESAGAVAALLRTGRGLWPVVAMTLSLPVLVQVADAVYRVIARHRHRLPGATSSCHI